MNNNCNHVFKNIIFGFVNFDYYNKANKVKVYKVLNKHISARVSISQDHIKSSNDKLKRKLEKKIEKFITVMLTRCKNTDLKYFFNNFSLSRFNVSNIGKESNILGRYTPITMTEHLLYLYAFSSTYHELMHMASTYMDDNQFHSGFRVSWDNDKQQIAKYFNEGYTQLMTEKYFNVVNHSYAQFVSFAEQIEELIGQEKMEKLYFEADFLGLVQELEKYNTKKSITKFFYDIDSIGELQKSIENVASNEELYNIKNEIRNKTYEVNDFINYCWKAKNLIDNNEYKA